MVISLIAVWFVRIFSKQPENVFKGTEMLLDSQDRILILAPHPDDEVLGCGGIIQKAVKMNLPVKVVFLTYGDNNQWSFIVYRKHPVVMPKAVERMGLIRHDEAIQAAKELGLPQEQLIFLGYPDFRTLEIWNSHWGDSSPAKGILTEIREVPYKNAFRPGAPYKADEILKDLKTIIKEFKPTKIFLSHPADHNSDHRALYLFTQIALLDLKKEVQPELYPYLIHFKQWPNPKGYKPQEQLTPPDFFKNQISWQIYNLTPEEVNCNYRAIKKHSSQYKSSPKYLLSFVHSNELFGDFPVVPLGVMRNSIPLELSHKKDLEKIPDELLDEERASFVGIEDTHISLEKNNIVFIIDLSRPLGKNVGVSLFVFGYNETKAFAEMPKLHVKFGALEHKIFDQDKQLPMGMINVSRKAKEINIRIPLEALGNPQYILTSVRTYIGVVPLDWTSWRILELMGQP